MAPSRRELLSHLVFGAALLPVLFRSPRSLLGHLFFDPQGSIVPAKAIPANPFIRNGKSLVAIVHGKDPRAMLRVGLDLLGGVEQLKGTGKRVLIKPNVLNNRPPPSTTNPSVIEAVVEIVNKAGAADIVVGDGSGIVRLPTSENLRATGIQAAAERAGATVMAVEDQPWVCVEPPRANVLKRYYVSKPVYEADIVINMPVIKTHRFAEYSCGLKNVVGVIHPRYRPSVTFLSGSWHERIAELNLAVHPHLTIADGTTVMIAGGPTSGTPASTDVLLLSGDRVAIDLVAIALLRSYGAWPKLQGKRIEDQRLIAHAAELGLGTNDARRIDLVSRSIEGKVPLFERLVDTIRRDVFNR